MKIEGTVRKAFGVAAATAFLRPCTEGRARRSGGLTRTIDPTKHREGKKEGERVKAVARAAVVRRFLVLRLQKEKVEILLGAA